MIACITVSVGLTPRNITIFGDERGHFKVKITDIMLSRILNSRTREGHDSYVEGYEAPDIWSEENAKFRDIFSLGGIMVYLFTHQQPFSNRNSVDRYLVSCSIKGSEIECSELNFMDDVEVEQIIIQCLSINPLNRPPAEKLRDRFYSLLYESYEDIQVIHKIEEDKQFMHDQLVTDEEKDDVSSIESTI